LAPWRANNTDIALPFPQPGPTEPAPVTIAIFPVKSSTLFRFPRKPHYEQQQI
jgi:hypothetical protein